MASIETIGRVSAAEPGIRGLCSQAPLGHGRRRRCGCISAYWTTYRTALSRRQRCGPHRRQLWWPKPSELRERCVSLLVNDVEVLGASEAWGTCSDASGCRNAM